eukprot:g71509.t1
MSLDRKLVKKSKAYFYRSKAYFSSYRLRVKLLYQGINKKKPPLAKVYWSFKIPTIPLELSLNIPVTSMSCLKVCLCKVTFVLYSAHGANLENSRNFFFVSRETLSLPLGTMVRSCQGASNE